jgi:hypothetical protein
MSNSNSAQATSNATPWLVIAGTHSPEGFDVEVWGQREKITFSVFEYLLELVATAFDDANDYLYNVNSHSCSKPRRDGDVDPDGTATDRVRHLRKVLKLGEVKTGNKGYQLDPVLDRAVVSERVLRNPYLDSRILARLKKSIYASNTTVAEH